MFSTFCLIDAPSKQTEIKQKNGRANFSFQIKERFFVFFFTFTFMICVIQCS